MKCYYEVLNVTRDADDATIKAAYKKLALRYHPDKNLDNTEEAKEQFQLVQQAYEVLSDRQERAWYDNHREQILQASNRDFQDKSLDLFQYFTTSCFKGYGDDENGFYTVYRNVFEQIAKEDMEFMEDKEEFCSIPSFGTSESDYETVVGPFYAYWSSYSTKKSFVWLDPYNATEIRGGKLFKLMEKENKKVRQKAKKERNEEVRNFVAFVRKRDKRVQAQTKLEEARRIENRQKHKQISLQKRRERQQQLNDSGQQAEWAKFDNVKSELEEIEKNLAKEFGEELSDSEEDEEMYNGNLYCIACNKVFKTEKAFQSHEFSKKHKENVAKLRRELLENENAEEVCDMADSHSEEDLDNICEEDLDDVCDAKLDGISEAQNGENDLLTSSSEVDKTESEGGSDKETNKKKGKQRQKKKQTLIDISDEVPIDSIVGEDADSDFDFSSSSKQKKKDLRKQAKKNKNNKSSNKDNEEKQIQVDNNIDDITDNIAQDTLQNSSEEAERKPKKNAKKTVKQVRGNSKKDDLNEMDTSHCCVMCKSSFASKNKLFDHLKKTGHSVYLPPTATKSKNKKSKTKEK